MRIADNDDPLEYSIKIVRCKVSMNLNSYHLPSEVIIKDYAWEPKYYLYSAGEIKNVLCGQHSLKNTEVFYLFVLRAYRK